jgi:hypothetical protein
LASFFKASAMCASTFSTAFMSPRLTWTIHWSKSIGIMDRGE